MKNNYQIVAITLLYLDLTSKIFGINSAVVALNKIVTLWLTVENKLALKNCIRTD